MKGPTLLLAALLSAIPIRSLRVTPGSDCQTLCTDGDAESSKTNTTDIVCKDKGFSDSAKGIKFKNCVSCLQDSDNVNGSDSDAADFVYNVRYAFDVCLYSYPDIPQNGFLNTPCNIDGACGPLADALQTSLLKSNNQSPFDYCDAAKDFKEGDSYDGCITCLQNTDNQKYFSNFLVAMNAACKQRPEDGKKVNLTGGLFTSELVNITNPEDDIRSRPEGAGSSTLTTGAIVGIAVGCGLLFLGAGVLIFIHCRRQRRASRERLDSPPPETPGGPRFITSSRKEPLPSKHKMSESISSFNQPRKMGHSREPPTNAEYYDQVESNGGNQGLGLNFHCAPTSKSNGPQGALPAHPAYIPRAMSRSSARTRSPPPTLKNNVTDSYALRAYLNTAEPGNVRHYDTARSVANHHSRSYSQPIRQPSPPLPTASRLPRSPPPPPPPPPPPSAPDSKHKPKVPSLVLPSLAKAKASKTYDPPQVIVTQPADKPPQIGQEISKPLAVTETRFHDRPLGGGTVMAVAPPDSFENLKKEPNPDTPMRSGHSRIMYG